MMFEKVNPAHPDKVADRIAGATVDLAYSLKDDPKIATEVLLGHGRCTVTIETDVDLSSKKVEEIIDRIAGAAWPYITIVKQDEHLAQNQSEKLRCGDNGIFKGMPVTAEQNRLTGIAELIYKRFPTDGKYILDADNDRIIVCQSKASKDDLEKIVGKNAIINPLGEWTGGFNVDTGCTNRKIGSDMGDAATGGGLHGKDLSKADVSVNIYAYLKAQAIGKPVQLCCAIGDESIDGKPYTEIVEIAREYINNIGGFEKFAEWGLLR